MARVRIRAWLRSARPSSSGRDGEQLVESRTAPVGHGPHTTQGSGAGPPNSGTMDEFSLSRSSAGALLDSCRSTSVTRSSIPTTGRDHREAREEGGLRREAGLPRPPPRLRRPHPDGPGRQRRRDRPARGHQRRRGRGGVRRAAQEGSADADQLVAPLQEPRREAEERRHLPGGRGGAEPLDPREGQGPVGGREAHAGPGPPDPRVRAHVRARTSTRRPPRTSSTRCSASRRPPVVAARSTSTTTARSRRRRRRSRRRSRGRPRPSRRRRPPAKKATPAKAAAKAPAKKAAPSPRRRRRPPKRSKRRRSDAPAPIRRRRSSPPDPPPILAAYPGHPGGPEVRRVRRDRQALHRRAADRGRLHDRPGPGRLGQARGRLRRHARLPRRLPPRRTPRSAARARGRRGRALGRAGADPAAALRHPRRWPRRVFGMAIALPLALLTEPAIGLPVGRDRAVALRCTSATGSRRTAPRSCSR